MDKFQKAEEILTKYNQENLKKILEKLDKQKQEELIEDILKTDFEKIINLYNNKDVQNDELTNIEEIEFLDKNKLTNEQKNEISEIGEKVIKQNQYAIVTMAGGQGTRLGWKGSKGTFKLDIGENGKYIFEILTDRLKLAKEKYGVEICWYIMTSVENNEETINFFEEHNYFGYNKEKIKFFKQNHLPLIDFGGNLLVDNNYTIKKASDGNGGVFEMLKKSGMISDMKQKGIKWIYICNIDNIMVNMEDTILLGLTIQNKMSSAAKSVKKEYPEERVGIFCKKNGRPAIINYTDMTEKMIYAKNKDGELLYGETNISNYLLDIENLEKIADLKLKYHCDKKKNSYIDEDLKEFIPQEPNTYKFELFVTDVFEYLDNMLILRVNREEEFAPIKNAKGVDSPETAKKIYENYYKENM